MTDTTARPDLRTQLDELHALLAQGQFLEAMDRFLADDVVLQEGNDPPKQGKAAVMDFEAKVLEGVASFGGYRVSSSAVAGDKTFYEAVMEYTQTDGETVRVEQCVVDTWKDGRIVHERFYHA